jgi:hypothetical protein
MTGQEKGDLLIQTTVWAGLTVHTKDHCLSLLKIDYTYSYSGFYGFMVFKATFNNISVISWRSVLLVEETGVPGENN